LRTNKFNIADFAPLPILTIDPKMKKRSKRTKYDSFDQSGHEVGEGPYIAPADGDEPIYIQIDETDKMKKLELLQLKREIDEMISEKLSVSPSHSKSGSQTSSYRVDSSKN
jgi:hypothetical protein